MHRLMTNLDFFGTSKMTVTKSQNRLRSFGTEIRAEVPARRNSSKYVTRLKSTIKPYKICAAKYELNFRRAFVLVLNRRREITKNYLRNFARRILSLYCTMDNQFRMLLKLRLLKLRRKRLLLSLLIKQRSYQRRLHGDRYFRGEITWHRFDSSYFYFVQICKNCSV